MDPARDRALSGKHRGLDELATEEGVFAVLAIDHRDSLRAVMPGSPTADDITEFKLAVLDAIGDRASGVMLEPEFTIPQAVDSGVLGPLVGFTAALEAQGYMSDPWAGPTEILAGWSESDAKQAGASAAKLLLPYSPDRPDHATPQEAVLADVVSACSAIDLALMVEPVAFGMAPPDRQRIVVESICRLTDSGVDLLKVEFPGDPGNRSTWGGACAAVTEAATVPWVLLSAGVTFEEYADQLAVAFEHGCSGFTGGRAIWGSAATADPNARSSVIVGEVVERMEHLRDLAVRTARPWREATPP